MTRDTPPKGGVEALRGDAGAMAVNYITELLQTIMLELSIMRILLGGFSVRKLRMVGPGSYFRAWRSTCVPAPTPVKKKLWQCKHASSGSETSRFGRLKRL